MGDMVLISSDHTKKHTEEYKATKSSKIHQKLKSKNLEIFKYALTE